MTETEALIALNQLPKIGPVKINTLVSRFGSAVQTLQASQSELTQVAGIGPESAGIIHDWESHADPSSEIALARERDIQIFTRDDANYPQRLRESHDAPVLLYVWGTLHARDDHGIAIVGSRRCTHYGRECARKFSFQLAQAGVTVVSGLARGIDTAAHEGALASQGRTIAVIGSGLMQLYPPENLGLAEKIADGHGAVVSEFPLKQAPDKRTFPQRNRIVAHWTDGTLVVECPSRSGSLITANLANEAGRQVYAVPGPIDRPTSGGCHDLIRDGATLVTDGSHILEDFQLLSFPTEEHPEAPLPNLSEEENSILQALGTNEMMIDELVPETGMPIHLLTTALMKMELKGLLSQLPGSRYRRKTGFSDS
ncbi:MAG: DNA-processing protein DprA [Akkermansiaceae bacterium]